MDINEQKLIKPINFDKRKSRMHYKYMIEDLCKMHIQQHKPQQPSPFNKRSVNDTSVFGNDIFID